MNSSAKGLTESQAYNNGCQATAKKLTWAIMNPLALTYNQCADHLQQRYGGGAFHATALYRAFYRIPDLDVSRLPAFSASPSLARQISRDLRADDLPVVRRACQDGVTKLVFALADGLEIETVIIPMAHHTTVCISCQAGCRMACRFCETGQMGWQRNLTAAEIVSQVYTVKVRMGFDVRNVVFMGMGEPLDNFEAVTQSIRIMEDQRGLDIAKRHITLSSVGLVEGIERLASLDWPQLRLAISLNAATDGLRRELMPIARHNPLLDLKRVLGEYPLARGNAIFVEYVLIRGVNDTPAQADQLAEYLQELPAKLNLIPYNPRRHSPYEAPTPLDIDRFQQALIQRKVFVRLRSAKGSRIRAACGQLGGSPLGPSQIPA